MGTGQKTKLEAVSRTKVKVRLDDDKTNIVETESGFRQSYCVSPSRQEDWRMGDFKVDSRIAEVIKYVDDLEPVTKEKVLCKTHMTSWWITEKFMEYE